MERSLRLNGVIENIRVACDFVVEVAEGAGLGMDLQYQCELSVDEIITNIVEHGYNHQGFDKHIDIICTVDEQVFTIRILDDAPLFDPLGQAEPIKDSSIEDFQIGGWGIHFVKKFMTSVTYKVVDNRNCLVLKREMPKE